MSNPQGLDGRLLAALGEDGPAVRAGSGPAGGPGAKSRVLAGIRQRRLRRLQLSGGAAVVVIGLAVSLPQVLGSTPAPPNRFATHGRSTTARSPAASPSASPAHEGSAAAPAGAPAEYGPRVTPAKTNGPVCEVSTRTVRPCGAAAKGAAGLSLTRAATYLEQAVNSTGVYGTATGVPATRHLVPSLVVHRGSTIVIELPRVNGTWRWTTPAIAGNPTYHGHGPPVVARATKTYGHLQKFVVKANVAVTVVLEAQADHYTGAGSPASIVEPPAVWALELEVEGT